ncbi:RDD family protein [Sphingobacterium sp. Mn56C]|uniref:RDD family protein n=1 Tax=Sphingobacterium sp. Mn56C TaxID=3395261 RepID=UPI003BEE298C
MNKLLINTPQNVNFAYSIAPVGKRIISFAIDIGIMTVYAILINVVLSKSGLYEGKDDWLIAGIVSLLFLPLIFYPLLLETFMDGQTIGKKIMKIKVVMIDGTRASIYQYFIRWVCNTVDIFIGFGGIGLTTIILSNKSQRIGDMAADTAVITVADNTNLKNTLFEEITAEHQIIYPEVIRLTDHDVNEIKAVLQLSYKKKNYQITQALAAKLELLLEVKAPVAPEVFINQVIQDHYYMFFRQ